MKSRLVSAGVKTGLFAALALALCAALVGCPSKHSPDPHKLGAGGASQTGQGPIPSFTTPSALGTFSTYGLTTGFMAMVGQNKYTLSTTSTFPVDGYNVVTGLNGGQWLRDNAQLQTIPASWQQTTWVVDPGNVSTCASDANATCSLSTCGTPGDGPCLTKANVLSRWGTTSPRLRQTTTLTQMSSDTTSADPGVFRPQMENGAQFVVQGLLTSATAVCSGTLLAITAKAQTTSGHTLESTFTLTNNVDGGTCTLAAGQLVVNTQATDGGAVHPGKAWLVRNVSAGNWLMTQPFNNLTGTTPAAPTENNNWANGDPVTIYAPTKINIAAFEPTINDVVGTAASGALAAGGIFDAMVMTPNTYYDAGTNADLLTLSANAYLVEAASQRIISLPNRDVYPTAFTLAENSWAMAGLIGGPQRALPSGSAGEATILWQGGAVGSSLCATTQANDVYFDEDAVFEPCSVYEGLNNSDLGVVDIDTSATVHVGGIASAVSSAINSSVGLVYGPGTLNIAGDARVQYTAGASEAAATFKVNTLTANNQTKGCSTLPSSSTITCNLTFGATQADTSLGATSGCLGPLGGASLCNYGP